MDEQSKNASLDVKAPAAGTVPDTDEAAVYSASHAIGILYALAGMALLWGFLHSVTFLGSVLGAQAEIEPGSAWIANSLATFSVFLVIFAASRRIAPLVERKTVLVLSAAFLLAGVCLLAVGNLILQSPACNYAGNAAVAMGTTPMIIMWGELYKYLNPKGEQLLITLAAAALAVALCLVETLLPAEVSVILFAAMPLASLGCIVRARDLLKESSSTWQARSPQASKKSPALFFVCIAVFSVPYNYLRNSEELQTVLASATDWPSVLAVAVVALVGIALAEAVAERRGALLVPGFVLFLLSAAMLMHLVHDMSSIVVPSLLYSGYYLFLAMVYLALGPIVAATEENPTRLFAGAMLANVAGLLLGSAMSGLERQLGVEGTTITVLAVAYALLIVGFALLNSRSYSLFRVNSFDEEEYSFEYTMPIVSASVFPSGANGAVLSMFDAIVQQCDAVAERYALSARESEVLAELARGRTIASIADQLVVSENTVKAHTKAIYRKLGVHTREELLQRIEDVSLPHER